MFHLLEVSNYGYLETTTRRVVTQIVIIRVVDLHQTLSSEKSFIFVIITTSIVFLCGKRLEFVYGTFACCKLWLMRLRLVDNQCTILSNGTRNPKPNISRPFGLSHALWQQEIETYSIRGRRKTKIWRP